MQFNRKMKTDLLGIFEDFNFVSCYAGVYRSMHSVFSATRAANAQLMDSTDCNVIQLGNLSSHNQMIAEALFLIVLTSKSPKSYTFFRPPLKMSAEMDHIYRNVVTMQLC